MNQNTGLRCIHWPQRVEKTIWNWTRKTKETIINFRRNKAGPAPLYFIIRGRDEQVSTFKFSGKTISSHGQNTTAIVKKGSANATLLGDTMCKIILLLQHGYCINVWRWMLYGRNCKLQMAQKIIKNNTHPGHELFALLLFLVLTGVWKAAQIDSGTSFIRGRSATWKHWMI